MWVSEGENVSCEGGATKWGTGGKGKKVRNSMQVGLIVSLVAYLFFVHACKCEYACMFVCMCLFVCVCLCVCVFVCVCVCVCLCVCVCVCVRVRTHTHTHTHMFPGRVKRTKYLNFISQNTADACDTFSSSLFISTHNIACIALHIHWNLLHLS